MPTMITCHRFELGFEDGLAGCGFLTGLEDVGFSHKKEAKLLDLFNKLPCPRIPGRCEFWFTEAGLREFANALDVINQELQKKGWYLVHTKTMKPQETAVYLDQWQGCWQTDEAVYEWNEFKAAVDMTE